MPINLTKSSKYFSLSSRLNFSRQSWSLVNSEQRVLLNRTMAKLLVIASEVRSGSTFLAEILSYTFNKLFGFEFWDLTKEHFNTINDSSSIEDILSIYDNIWVNQFNFKSSKLMCSSISVLNRESKISEYLKNVLFW